jgi:hypothetical protein
VNIFAEIIEAYLDGPRGMKNKVIQTVGVHTCTEEEWANLYPAKDDLD